MASQVAFASRSSFQISGVLSSEMVRPKGSLNSWAMHSRLYTASRMAMSARSLFWRICLPHIYCMMS